VQQRASCPGFSATRTIYRVSPWKEVALHGGLFSPFFGLARWFFIGGWSNEITFRKPSSGELAEIVFYGLWMGALFGITTVFHWQAFRGIPLVVLVALLVSPLFIAMLYRFGRRPAGSTRP
jgi:hypothetical protein